MKFVLALIAIITVATSTPLSENTSVFLKVFNNLHQEPPPPPVSPTLSRAATIVTDHIKQKLDHFDDTNTKEWDMRYLSSDEHFKAGGPIFIFVGGEWAVSNGYLQGGHMYDMAKEHNGYMFYTEHRFYGESYPTDNLATENLKYLDVKQALTDLKHFIETKKKEISGLENSKVILTGGSYSATMVTWFQRMYPGVAVGSWASSAPLLAKVDFFEYKEVTGQSIIKMAGQECYDRIQNAVTELESMFDNSRAAEVKAIFKLCNNFDQNNKWDVYSFFSEISDIFAGVVQTHTDNKIQSACNTIMEADDDVQGLAKFILGYLGPTTCYDFSYKSLLDSIGDTTFSSNIFRQWMYQTCNEYGWYQTSNSSLQPFGKSFPVDLYVKMCNDIYGIDEATLYNNIDKTNVYFNGLNPEVDNVYITHGELDPWRAMGLQEEGKATIIPKSAHCKDFGSISSSDTAEMRASKEKIAELVRGWVA